MESGACRCARLITEAFVKDISRRKGLGNEWEEITDHLREEIQHTWYLKALAIVRSTMGTA